MADRAGSAGLKQVLMDLDSLLINMLGREILRSPPKDLHAIVAAPEREQRVRTREMATWRGWGRRAAEQW